MIAPWVFLILTGIWFGYIGYKADGRWIAWAIGGALFGLTASTMVIGLCDAAYIPLSHSEETMVQLKTMVFASLPMLLVGGCIMLAHSRSRRLNPEKTVTSR